MKPARYVKITLPLKRINSPAQEKNLFYKEHYPGLMMNLLIWRTFFMYFALELVKKRWK